MKLVVFHCKQCLRVITDTTKLEQYTPAIPQGEFTSLISFNKIDFENLENTMVHLRNVVTVEEACNIWKESDWHLGYYIKCTCNEILGIYLASASEQIEHLRDLYSLQISKLKVYDIDMLLNEAKPTVKPRTISTIASCLKLEYEVNELKLEYREAKDIHNRTVNDEESKKSKARKSFISVVVPRKRTGSGEIPAESKRAKSSSSSHIGSATSLNYKNMFKPETAPKPLSFKDLVNRK